MKKCTQGPWEIINNKHAAPEIVGPAAIGRRLGARQRPIAKVLYDMGSEDNEVQGNAYLIAAAPDLLEACTDFCDALTVLIRADDGRIAQEANWREKLEDAWATIIIKQSEALRAIAKARGE